MITKSIYLGITLACIQMYSILAMDHLPDNYIVSDTALADIKLIERQATVTRKLHDAVTYGQLEDLDILLRDASRNHFFYDLCQMPSRGDTMLHTLARQGTDKSGDLLRRLIKEGYAVDHTSSMLGHTALHVAAASLDPRTTELLLELGADPAETVSGYSALDLTLWTAIGSPKITFDSLHAMLTDMRQQAVARITKEEQKQRALQVVVILLTHIPQDKRIDITKEGCAMPDGLYNLLKTDHSFFEQVKLALMGHNKDGLL